MTHNYDQAELDIIQHWLGSGSINIFGMPFAGKDTQGQILAELFDTTLLGGGDILRNSTIPDHVRTIMRQGELIPTDDYIAIVLPYLQSPQFAGKPLILSSVGRWHGEESGVIDATNQSNHPIKAVIYLNATKDMIMERHASDQAARSSGGHRNREDDDPAVLQVRLDEFINKTMPVVDFYRTKPNFIEIDSDQSPVQITARILAQLKIFATVSA